MAGKVFLNYRRSDAEAWADRLFERLVRILPREDVFMDLDGSIPLGLPWVEWLDSQVANCDLMIVLVGRTWVTECVGRAASAGPDYVKVEIESALKRKIPIVPVFLGETPVPSSMELPEPLRPLLQLQAARLQRVTFDRDAEALTTGIARSIALSRRAQTGIKIDASIAHGAPNFWFGPGAGKTEWFQDLDLGPEMVVVPAGKYRMGSYDFDIERPPREVSIDAPFAVSRFAITFAEWDAAKLAHVPTDEGWGRDRRPVIHVSWDDAKDYVAWLSRTTSKPYRLGLKSQITVCEAGPWLRIFCARYRRRSCLYLHGRMPPCFRARQPEVGAVHLAGGAGLVRGWWLRVDVDLWRRVDNVRRSRTGHFYTGILCRRGDQPGLALRVVLVDCAQAHGDGANAANGRIILRAIGQTDSATNQVAYGMARLLSFAVDSETLWTN